MSLTDTDEPPELGAVAYLRDLAERLMRVPVMYGTNQYDVDRLDAIARAIEEQAPHLKDVFG
jgi:hypothetical protein